LDRAGLLGRVSRTDDDQTPATCCLIQGLDNGLIRKRALSAPSLAVPLCSYCPCIVPPQVRPGHEIQILHEDGSARPVCRECWRRWKARTQVAQAPARETQDESRTRERLAIEGEIARLQPCCRNWKGLNVDARGMNATGPGASGLAALKNEEDGAAAAGAVLHGGGPPSYSCMRRFWTPSVLRARAKFRRRTGGRNKKLGTRPERALDERPEQRGLRAYKGLYGGLCPPVDLYGAIGVKTVFARASPCSTGQRHLLVPT
jgi:hypothetical protein